MFFSSLSSVCFRWLKEVGEICRVRESWQNWKLPMKKRRCQKNAFPNQHDIWQSDIFIDDLRIQSHTPLGLKPKLLPGFTEGKRPIVIVKILLPVTIVHFYIYVELLELVTGQNETHFFVNSPLWWKNNQRQN